MAVFAPFSNMIYHGSIVNTAEANSALTQANLDSWMEVPGIYNFTILKDHWLYNCTNFNDVSNSAFG